MFHEPLNVPSGSLATGAVLVNFSDPDPTDLLPASFDQLDDLRRQYASLLIQLDHLRPLLASADVHYRTSEQEWSIKEMLGHLIDTDRDIWWPRIVSLLERDECVFTDVDQNELVVRHHWQSLPTEDILAQLMRVRWDYAMKLNAIPDVMFHRSGSHPTLGSVSLLRIVDILVAHDAHYLGKIRGQVEEARNSVSY